MENVTKDEEVKMMLAFMAGFLAGQEDTESDYGCLDVKQLFDEWLEQAKSK